MNPDMLLPTTNLDLLPSSLVAANGMELGLSRPVKEHRLAVLADFTQAAGFDGEKSEFSGKALLIGPLNPQNAAYLRAHLDWLNPRLLGLGTSAGLGDRIGLATAGHVRAVRETEGRIAPIFAQQSIREMTRTNRSPQQVMDDALWGMVAEGWQGGFGADADHLMTEQDIDSCLAAGYTFYTIDPRAHVNDQVEHANPDQLKQFIQELPAEVRPEASGLAGRAYDIEGRTIEFTPGVLATAAVKYGRAVLHVAGMYAHLAEKAGARPFELEVSVDETNLPTTFAEHVYIASELKRLGVKWVSLAPRFIGRFEKGVDYIGDLAAFEADVSGHAAIARQMGPYKLSLHSGSDKFSIYPLAMRHTRGLVHLKTAGTSYLEALRTIAAIDPAFFKEIYGYARRRYEIDSATYHVSAQLQRAPDPEEVQDWPALLNQFDARQILHVTFGSVLTDHAAWGGEGFYHRFIEILQENAELYAENLHTHFRRHLTPFLSISVLGGSVFLISS